jgi:hypothetical protein
MPDIEIDTSHLTFPLFTIPGTTIGFVDGSMVPTPKISLSAHAGYRLQQSSAALSDFEFEVKDDGTFDFEEAFDTFVTGRGETRLTVLGLPVRLDFTALDHALLPLLARASPLPADRTHYLSLLPCPSYGFQLGSGVVADLSYGVALDGKVILDAQFSGFAQAEGNTLTILGNTINIDGRTLSHDLTALGIFPPGQLLSHDTVNQLTLIPTALGGYGFQPGSGIIADLHYGVARNGAVILDAQFSGFAHAEGNTLTIRGYPIVLNAAAADSDLVGIVQVEAQSQAPRELIAVLVPAKGYRPQTVNGVFSTAFNIELDGRITFDPAAASRYIVKSSTSPNPSVVGEEVTIRVYIHPVESMGDTPQGTVSLRVGAALFGSTTLDASGQATLRTAVLPQGEHDISVDYTGNPVFEPSSVIVHHRVV